MPPTESRQKKFTTKLLAWGEKNRRDFPWRIDRNPYEIFVAESLVQRTRASQAASVYRAFLHKWPTVTSLAHAREPELKAVIGTLGLTYRGARLRKVAAQIVNMFGGIIPDTLYELKALYGSGFGDYMSHAILCFGFEQDVPVVDKNVQRILKRVFSFPARADAHRDPKLWAFAGRLVPAGKSREYNWSLLDFGALVCTPRSPRCSTCPMLELCDFGRSRASVA